MRDNFLKGFGAILLAGVLAASLLVYAGPQPQPAPQDMSDIQSFGNRLRRSSAPGTISRTVPTAISADTAPRPSSTSSKR